jgi:PAS domain S-box-containing protein
MRGLIVVLLDSEGSIVLINTEGCTSIGYTQQEIMGKNWFDMFVTQGAREERRRAFDKRLNGQVKDSPTYESRVITKYGDEKIISWHDRVTTDENGFPCGLLLLGEDITEKKNSEDKLKHINEVLHALRTINRCIAQEKDRKLFLSRICREFTTIQAYDRAWIDLVDKNGQLIQRFGSEGGAENLHPCSRKAIRETRLIIEEKPFSPDTDGALSEKRVEGTVVSLPLLFGQTVYGVFTAVAPAGVEIEKEEKAILQELSDDIAFALHISETVEEKQRVERKNVFKENLLSAVQQAIIATDINGNIIYWNTAAETIYGWSEEEAVGHHLCELLPCLQKQGIASDSAVPPEQKKYSAGEFRITRKNGTTFPAIITDSPLYDEEGNPSGVVRITTDISDLKETENALLEREEELKHNIEEKDVLLKEIHHRVRNNLNIISSLLHLHIEKITTKETAVRAFRDCIARTHAMAAVHGQLYESNRLSSIDVSDYIKKVVRELQAMYDPEDSITISCELEDVSLDISKAIPCGLIINEVITNAFKYAFSRKTDGCITVTLEVDEQKQCCLKVADNGCGLPDHIDPDTPQTLGLTLINKLTEQINGTSRLYNHNGAVFLLYFLPGKNKGDRKQPD